MATPRSTSFLNGLWVTGYTPTQANFQDLFASYQNIVDNNTSTGVQTTLNNVYPSSQGTAALVTALSTRVLNGGAGKGGIKLSPAIQGNVLYINNAAAYTTDIYPATGEIFYDIAPNTPITLFAGQACMLIAGDEGVWYFFPFTDAGSIVYTYKAIVNQSGTAAPVATKIQNELGINPTWSRSSAGIYLLTGTGKFDVAKTFIQVSQAVSESPHNGGFIINASVETSPNTIKVTCLDDSFTNIDNNQFFINIQVMM
jgi:hypothetical protein